MSHDPNESSSLLAPFADAYEPSEADADRIFSKIQASLAAEAASSSAGAPSSPPAAPPRLVSGANARRLLIGLSCAAMVVVGGVTVQQLRGGPSSSSSSSSLAAPTSEPAAPKANTDEEHRPEGIVEAPPAMPSVSVDALPQAVAPSASTNVKAPPVAVVSAPIASPAKPMVAESSPVGTPSESARSGAADSASSPAPPSDTLGREAALLADARRAVQRGDNPGALALLDEHARTFPNGWLAADRAAERIVVLCSLGRRDEAVREAAAFLQGRPKSPLTRRIALSCAGEP